MENHFRNRILLGILAVCGWSLNAAAQVTIEAAFQSGVTAPDGNGILGNASVEYSNHRISNAGIVVTASLDETFGGTNDNGAILFNNGTDVIQIAREGDSAVGNGNFGLLGGAALNNSGQIAFNASRIENPNVATNDSGVFMYNGSNLMALAREGDAVPGRPGMTFSGFTEINIPTINDAGQVAFPALLENDAGVFNGSGLFLSDGATLQTLVSGDAPGGGRFDAFIHNSISLSESGALVARTRVAVTSGSTELGIVSYVPGSGVNFVAREGDQSPMGLGEFASFDDDSIALNNNHQLIFAATLRDTPSLGINNNEGIFFDNDISAAGGLSTFIREQDVLDASILGEAGLTVRDIDVDFARNLTDNGDFVFSIELDGTVGGVTDNEVLMRGNVNTGEITPIFREGDATGFGGTFGSRINNELSINEAGQVFFALSGIEGVGTNEDSGTFLFDDEMGVVQITREGDSFLGSTLGAVSSLETVRDFSLDEDGRAAFVFSLDDGRAGVAVAQITQGMGNGDFNGDGSYDCADIDALVSEIANEGNSASFDLDGDGIVNRSDIDAWLAEAGEVNIGPGRSYLNGDANLDGSVDVSDFGLWNANKFTETGAWCLGDFNADGVSDVSDFSLWNNHKFTSSDVASVPEPDSIVTILLGLAGLLIRYRSKS